MHLPIFAHEIQYILPKNLNLQGIKDNGERLKIILCDLFNIAFRHMSRMLLHEDYITFVLQIRSRGTPNRVDDTACRAAAM